MKVIIYLSNWNWVGGVERFTQNFCKRMAKHVEVTFLYDNVASQLLVDQMKQYCEVKKANFKELYTCDIFISASAWGRSAYDIIDAKCYVHITHADYRHEIDGWKFKYKKHPKTTHHVCVGKIVKEGFEEITGIKSDAVIYNLLDNTVKYAKKSKNKVLTLITCSRIALEKGFDRMHKMAKELDSKGIDYVWNVFGDDSNDYARKVIKKFKDCPNVHFKGVTTNAPQEINKADYLVQLSDTEGFPYSVYEAMQAKTLCIITPYASGKEQIKDGKNGYIVPFDMNGIDWDKIASRKLKITKFTELGKEEDWLMFFNKAMKWYEENSLSVKIVLPVQLYKVGQIITLPKERAISAVERGLAEFV